MILRIGIENNNDDRSIAWALNHPGCFAYGKDADEAQSNFPQAARDYVAWIARHGESWIDDEVDVVVEESFEAYFVNSSFERVEPGNDTFMVESFFLHDWKPLDPHEIERALKMLAWSRHDLLSLVESIDTEWLNRTHPNERWSIRGILKHIGGAEWWYQERIGFPFPEREPEIPDDPFERLALVRDHFMSLLPKLNGMTKVVGLEGELWSPRKVLRRAIWHERDHTEHIRKLIGSAIP
ncbi:MAG TPA: DinB family protein [Anaerolineales bacterium]|nr:DinB family protein [Anaerolineales bacterium]